MRTERMLARWIPLAATLFLLAGERLEASSVTLAAGDLTAKTGGEVLVPVTAEAAQKMGALMLDLTYDPAILEAVAADEFQDEDLAAGAAVEANVVKPGRWRVALARSEAIEGGGTLLRLKFRTLAEGQCALGLESVRAWDQSNPPLDMLVEVRPGSVTVGGSAVDSNAMMYGLIGAGVVIVVAIGAMASRRKGRPASARAAPPPPVAGTPAASGACPKCGAARKPESRFCANCGQALEPAPPEEFSSPRRK